MRSTPSWVHELVPTKHEGVAKIHLERVERKGTWTVRYELEDSFVVHADVPRAFRQRTKIFKLPSEKRQAHRMGSSQVVVVWAWAKHHLVLASFRRFLLRTI